MRFFLKHAVRDIKRKKCNFCLAFCSIFVAVGCTLIVNTLLAQGPIVFLKLAEWNWGQVDAIFTPSPYSYTPNGRYYKVDAYLNYT